MKPKLIFYLCVLIILLNQVQSSNIQVDSDGGYQNVVMTVSENVEYSDDILSLIKEFYTQVSEQLFISTFNSAFIKSLIIILPNSWHITEQLPSSFVFSSADIKFENTNNLFQKQDVPYTQQPRSCGEKGNFIYLTADYIKKWKENKNIIYVKKFVQEWAKLRYGVFEETGDKMSVVFPHTYVDANGKRKRTGCAVPDPAVSLDYTVNGTFQVHSSIMDDVSLNANVFCNDNLHNSHAPTRHNALCNRMSTWEIISQSSDFANISKTEISNQKEIAKRLIPNFIMGKMDPMTIVVVIDPFFFSPTKNSLLWFTLQQLIQLLPQDSSLGLVRADAFSNRLPITSNFDPAYMLRLTEFITNPAKSTTKLKQGIDTAITMLKGRGNRKHVILLSSGPNLNPESTLPVISNELKSNSLTFFLLTWTANTDLRYTYESMKLFTDYQHNSLWFNIPTPSNTQLCNLKHRYLMEDAFVEYFNRFNSVNLQNKYIKIKTETGEKSIFEIPVNSANIYFKTFYCDMNFTNDKLIINKENNFQLSKDIEGFAISYLWKSNLPEKSKIEFEWTTDNKNLSKEPQTSLWFVTNSILLTGQLEKSKDISLPNILYGYYSGVLEIKAKVVTPTGTVEYIELRDNGNGDPDVKAKDGVFSRYFIYSNMVAGMHSISIIAIDSTGKTLLQTDLGNFILPLINIIKIPPNWIGDFHVKKIDTCNGFVSFQWTAPGGDFDHNSPSAYYLYCDVELSSKFDTVTGEKLKIIPQESGKEEVYRWRISCRNTLYYCGIVSVDNNNNRNKISNIVTAYVPELPPTINPEEVTTSTTKNSQIEIQTQTPTKEDSIVFQEGQSLTLIGIVIGGFVILGILIIAFSYLIFKKINNLSKIYSSILTLNAPNNVVSFAKNLDRATITNLNSYSNNNSGTSTEPDASTRVSVDSFLAHISRDKRPSGQALATVVPKLENISEVPEHDTESVDSFDSSPSDRVYDAVTAEPIYNEIYENNQIQDEEMYTNITETNDINV